MGKRVDAIHGDLAAVGRAQPGDDGRPASSCRPVRSEQADDLAGGRLEVDAAQDVQLAV